MTPRDGRCILPVGFTYSGYGGESGDPKSPHFNDEAQRYATGNLREVYFYPGQLKGHTQRTYHPGDLK